LLLSVSVLIPERSDAKFQWEKSLFGCEPPATFYSTRHIPGLKPCCPLVEGMCASGVACPVSGVCPSTATACSPAAPAGRPNIILMISDDHGDCQYGSAGECRSPQKGLPIPAPVTPSLDLLAGHGTVFTVAHNTASWCFPSLFSMVTGRYQKSFGDSKKPADTFGAIPRSLRLLLGATPAAQPDPYDVRNSIGGYCSFLGGKLTDRLGNPGFHARGRTGERSIARTKCIDGAPGQPPKCGSGLDPVYDPTQIFRGSDLFEFLDTLLYRVPGPGPATFAMQNFFAWYAPRIPHQPLRAPLVIRNYLFGSGPAYPLGGIFDLGQYCSGASCPPSVTALDETVFGDVHELFGNLWWMDDSLREIRQYLERQGSPHCIATNGKSRFDIATPGACGGTWAEAITPDLPRNTVIMTLADNGWHLPDSKHSFTENGYRTRLIVFDPRNLPVVPSSDPGAEVIPPPQETFALAHAVDLHATAMGFALGTPGAALCPLSPDGSGRCDGKDLRPHLVTAPGGPAAPDTLRKAMCGHFTQKPTSPTKSRYLITRQGAVGRCANQAAPVCASDAQCAPSGFCLEGHCAPRGEMACSTNAQCPSGAVCLGLKCRAAPPCIENADCTSIFPGGSYACVAKQQQWCRNDPSVACSTRDDCPACPPGAAACSRLCEARMLKFYVNPGASVPELTDLFADPDEVGLHKGGPGDTTLTYQMSQLGGAYGPTIRRANCCIDEWWPEASNLGSACMAGYSCPSELSCQ
jgi:hypothetical protein